ncbi:MAG TPA: SRPBCC family protein [Bacteroidota bacterium]|nr:SRPBCC family protein [Bacteroidota bacterium]
MKHTVKIAAPPQEAYRRMTGDVARWWASDHTFSGDARNLSIDPNAGGCFCEKLPGGGSVRHMVVVYADPGKVIRLQGGIGPMQALAVNGTLTWTFLAEGSGTRLEVVYTVGGYSPHGLQAMSIAADRVLGVQVERLKRLIETGEAGAAPAQK